MSLIKYIILSAVVLLIVSCSSLKVEKLSSESEIKKSGIIYTLPKTKLNIKVDIVKTTQYKGPFSEYANEYLGIKNVIKNNSTFYSIDDVTIKPTIVNDNNNTYLLKNYVKSISSVDYYNGTNVISAINTSNKVLNKCEFNTKEFVVNTNYIPFKDRTLKPLVVEKSDTIWKTLLIDSVYKRIPKINKAIAPRTVKEQAYLASRFILKIRKNRFKLAAGILDKMPNGKSLKQMIVELNKLEKNYLELFAGKTITDTANYKYSLVPDSNLTYKTLFTFDKQKGISENSLYSITIIFEDENKVDSLVKNIIPLNNQFVYRTAKTIKTRVFTGDKTIYNEELPIYQVGILKYMPNEITSKKVMFNNNSGNFLIQE